MHRNQEWSQDGQDSLAGKGKGVSLRSLKVRIQAEFSIVDSRLGPRLGRAMRGGQGRDLCPNENWHVIDFVLAVASTEVSWLNRFAALFRPLVPMDRVAGLDCLLVESSDVVGAPSAEGF